MKKQTISEKQTERVQILAFILTGDVAGMQALIDRLSDERRGLLFNTPIDRKLLIRVRSGTVLSHGAMEALNIIFDQCDPILTYSQACLFSYKYVSPEISAQLLKMIGTHSDLLLCYGAPSVFQMAAGASEPLFSIVLDLLKEKVLNLTVSASAMLRDLLTYTDANGLTALHYSARAGLIKTTAFLIKCGAVCHVTDKTGYTALHVADINGHTAVAAYLSQVALDDHSDRGRVFHPIASRSKSDPSAIPAIKINGAITPAYRTSLLKRLQDRESISDSVAEKSAFTICLKKM